MSLQVQELSFGARLRHRIGVVADSLRRNPTMLFGVVVLALMAGSAFLAPWLGLPEPMHQSPRDRLQEPTSEALFGTDMYGRDLFSRVLHGGQVSLVVGLSVAALATSMGLFIGLISGFIRSVDAVIMR